MVKTSKFPALASALILPFCFGGVGRAEDMAKPTAGTQVAVDDLAALEARPLSTFPLSPPSISPAQVGEIGGASDALIQGSILESEKPQGGEAE